MSAASSGDVDFVSLYYRSDAMSLDEDEFSELAAHCASPCKRALGELEHALLLDRHCAVQGVFVSYDALTRELDPLHAPARCAASWTSKFGELLAREPALAIGVLQTAIHTLVSATDVVLSARFPPFVFLTPWLRSCSRWSGTKAMMSSAVSWCRAANRFRCTSVASGRWCRFARSRATRWASL